MYLTVAGVLNLVVRAWRRTTRVIGWSAVFLGRFVAPDGTFASARGLARRVIRRTSRSIGRGTAAPGAGPASGRRISWDVIRVLAVLAVLLYHGTTLGVQWHPELGERPLRFPYQVGAGMLLLISGYFAAASLRRGDPVRWWAGRLFRIVPAYLVAVLVTAVALRLTAPPGWWVPSPMDVPVNWLMLWNWQPARYAFVDPSYWTLPLQLIWFTVLAWLYARARPAGPRAETLLWSALAAQWLTWPLHVWLHGESVRVWYEGLGVHRVHLFVAGLALYRWSRGRLTHGHALALVGACLLAHRVQTGHTSWTAGLAIGCAMVALAARGPDWDRFVRGRFASAVRWLAGIGYGVYLTHQALGYRVMWWLARAGVGPAGQLAAMIGAAVLTGWALSRLVERPAHAALMAWYDRTGAAGSGSGAAGADPVTGPAGDPPPRPAGDPPPRPAADG